MSTKQTATTFIGELNFSGTTIAGFKANSLTTTQRDALTAANGMVIYNSTTSTFQVYQASAWIDIGGTNRTATFTVAPTGTAADYNTDGVADNVQINDALLAINSLGGGSLLIRAGTYNIEGTLNVYSHTKIFGEGFSTILKFTYAPSTSCLFIRNGNQASGDTQIIISDMQLDGNTNLGSLPRNMVYLDNTSKSIVERLYIHNTPDSAIVLDQAGTTGNIIRDNIIDTTDDIGIYNSVATNNLLIGNQIMNTGSYGIRVINGGGYTTVESNRVYNCGQGTNADGIRFDNSDSSTCTGNFVAFSGSRGIFVSSSYMTVIGNNVQSSDKEGIYLDGPQRSTVTGNIVHLSGQQGANLYSGIYLNSASECTITGNRSGDTAGTRQKYGIEEGGTSDYNIISSNMLRRNETAGLLTVGANTVTGVNLQ